MPTSTIRALIAATGVAVVAVGAACSSSSTPSSGPTPSFETNPPKTTPTTVVVKTAACDRPPLAAALAAAKADATLGDFACSSTFAVGTVEGPGLAQWGEAGFFTVVEDGQWSFVKTVKVDDATLSAAPTGFPQAVYQQWLPKYQRPARTSTTLCLYYDPATKGCTDKAPAGVGGGSGAGASGQGGAEGAG
ncbi:MAG: hypothetical protein U0Q07_11610 [Acidimicrobiales bacterium]